MKRTTIQVRCTEEQKDIVIARMQKAGFSNLSEYCRVKLIEGCSITGGIIDPSGTFIKDFEEGVKKQSTTAGKPKPKFY